MRDALEISLPAKQEEQNGDDQDDTWAIQSKRLSKYKIQKFTKKYSTVYYTSTDPKLFNTESSSHPSLTSQLFSLYDA